MKNDPLAGVRHDNTSDSSLRKEEKRVSIIFMYHVILTPKIRKIKRKKITYHKLMCD